MGSRVMTVWVDGKALASNIDIFKDVGLNTAVGAAGKVTASSSRMNVTITSVRTPTRNANGPVCHAASRAMMLLQSTRTLCSWDHLGRSCWRSFHLSPIQPACTCVDDL